jgi:Tfp pilus assembly protein PilN
VWFRELSQKGMTITIRGDSTSFEAINLFRNRLLERRQWFQNVNYPANLPAASRTGRTVEFTISFDLKNSA